MGRMRIRASAWTAIGALVGAAIVLSLAVEGGVPVYSHTACTRGATLSTVLQWTPFSLANAPYGGETYYSASFSVYDLLGLSEVRLTNGQVRNGAVSSGYFETENWTIFSLSNTTALGPGLNDPCTSPYGAAISPTRYSDVVDGATLRGRATPPMRISQQPSTTAVRSRGWTSKTGSCARTFRRSPPAIRRLER
jgi:hypothetical protein